MNTALSLEIKILRSMGFWVSVYRGLHKTVDIEDSSFNSKRLNERETQCTQMNLTYKRIFKRLVRLWINCFITTSNT